MPISHQEFESTLDRTTYLALEFLRSNMDAAYTASEIAEALGQEDISLSEPALERALVGLVSRLRRR